MTTLDDDRLAALFAQAGASFDVPAAGPDDILTRAAGRLSLDGPGATNVDPGAPVSAVDGDGDGVTPAGHTPGPGRVRRLTRLASRHRVLSVAACVVVALVLAGTVSTILNGPAHPTRTTALAKVPAHESTKAPSTTTTTGPGFGTNATSGSQQRVLPFSTAQGTSAGASGGLSAAAPNDAAGTTTPTTAPDLPKGAVGQPAKIQQTGSLALTVGRGQLAHTVTALTNLAAASGGFVANSQTQSAAAGGGTASGSVTLQVPVGNFATVLRQAQALGKPSDLTTKATDVSAQDVDLQSRISALQETRQQYLTILAKATTVGDVLAVQEQVNTIQSQIEQLQGQLQLLTSQTSYSTLSVTVSEGTPPPRPRPGTLPESGLVRAWHSSIGGFVSGVEGVIRIAGPLLFALLLAAAVLLGGRVLWRRYQRHNL
jgi:hypothetical protein